ncbi:uncharacterized protein LOC111701362 [Eurytemora carolleeae]|uniref:uncharacterized protein LOC111701362 n=1 Tax=Eurytemora carolleeae TaxID=1294199 RepID=UPI000C76F0BA|nr:uncharacterized protein LOC111701362 [Eurytemora carolleeae]|eukprot:XP_023328385.1 uncharacterized protein LOC111701362 [Eurytemora affinis]
MAFYFRRETVSGRAEKYDIDGNLVETLPNCRARYSLGCAVYNGDVWAAGGFDGTGTYWTTTEVYTKSTNSWKAYQMNDNPSYPQHHVFNNQLMVFGSRNPNVLEY